MSNGLRVWSAGGGVILDISHRITRLHAIIPVEVGNTQYLDVVYSCDPATWGAFASNLNIIPVVEIGYIRCWRYVFNSATPVQAGITLFRY